MSNKLENLKDLFLYRAWDLYDASLLEQNELIFLKSKVSNNQLAEIIEREIDSAKNQAKVLLEIFETMREKHSFGKDLCCRAIFEEAKGLLSKSKDREVMDAAIIDSIQRLNHNNISSLGSLTAFAIELELISHSQSLRDLLEEEKTIDKLLSELAINQVNKGAALVI